VADDYPLEELSHRAFEQMIVALALCEVGSGVEAFGSGPDGGREATFSGQIEWSKTGLDDAGAWDGYVVFQAKQAERNSTYPAENLKWLKQQVDDELDSWMADSSKRGQFPDYLIFITNVRLSSVPGSGIDAINSYIEHRLDQAWEGKGGNTLRKRGLRDWRVWHRDQLTLLLTAHQSVRLAFKSLLTVGDLLSRLGQLNGLLDPEELAPVLGAHATSTLTTERWVSFREAGGTDRESVERIIIDLHATRSKIDGNSRDPVSVLNTVFSRSDTILKPSVLGHGSRPHMVLTGQAGGGKSTITRFLTQAARSGFVRDEDLSPTEIEVLDGTASALSRVGVGAPRGRRWPLRVDLAQFADALGPDGSTDLLRWMSNRVSARAGLDINPRALQKWLTYWPSLIIFDGLDEVTSPEVRPRVLDEITHFVEQSEKYDADLLVIVTTRPTGYTERLMPTHFEQFDLTYLDETQAVEYGRLVTDRRLADDIDRRDQLITSFEKHAKQPAMLRLMKTPLQVLIMTIILERAGVLPPDRYQLFSRYFETIYDRESAKPTHLTSLLGQHRSLIVDPHEAAGLYLQRQSESSGDARAVLQTAELQMLLEARLVDLGYAPGTARDHIAEKVMQATTERLVLLVPAEDDSVAFEVRSLQELMAARQLLKGTDDDLKSRMTIAAPSPHWRNTWVFLAGALFAQGSDHRRELVVRVAESIDTESFWPGWLTPTGPELAAALLDDGLASQAPKWHRRLVDVALRALSGPFPADSHTVAMGLSAAAAERSLWMHIRNSIKLAIDGVPRASMAARILLVLMNVEMNIPRASLREGEMKIPNQESVYLGQVLRSCLSEMPDPEFAATLLDSTIDALEHVRVGAYGSNEIGVVSPSPSVSSEELLVAVVNDPVAGGQFELLVGSIDPELWRVQLGLGMIYRASAARRPIGGLL
jgi:hypothetical protein